MVRPLDILDEEVDMAEKPLVNVPPTVNVTAAETEQWKLEKVAEREFLWQLGAAVNDLKARVSPRNQVLMSMQRFLKARM